MDPDLDAWLSAVKTRKRRIIATPYSFIETIGVVWRNMAGVDPVNRGDALQFIPSSHPLNPITKKKTLIAFLGDIMSVGRLNLIIDPSVHAFLSGCDYLVGNLEATITRQRRRPGVLLGAFQRQDVHVLEALADLFPPDRTYLSVANNHTGDFEARHYMRSCDLLKEKGFHLFGQRDRPYVDVNPHVRVHAGSMWSNQICSRIHWLETGCEEVDPKRTNILFPHWGYELEIYPRPETVQLAKRYARQFDAILGHHPHAVQPVTARRAGNANRLIAYSLGDFCSSIPMEAYRYGIIAKLDVGPGLSGNLRIGHVEWRFLKSCRRERNRLAVRLAHRVPYFESRG